MCRISSSFHDRHAELIYSTTLTFARFSPLGSVVIQWFSLLSCIYFDVKSSYFLQWIFFLVWQTPNQKFVTRALISEHQVVGNLRMIMAYVCIAITITMINTSFLHYWEFWISNFAVYLECTSLRNWGCPSSISPQIDERPRYLHGFCTLWIPMAVTIIVLPVSLTFELR